MEDDFCAGRPDWDRVGATFSDDVHDYEMMKIRILNGGHQVHRERGRAPVGPDDRGLHGASADPRLFRKVQEEEIVPHVRPVPGMTPEAYLDLIDRRFSNPAIVDTTRRVAFDGSARHPGFILPILREALATGRAGRGLALVEALWARMCAGTREDGTPLEPNDPLWAKSSRGRPTRAPGPARMARTAPYLR
jgi:mannitol 2-dehydrogenase